MWDKLPEAFRCVLGTSGRQRPLSIHLNTSMQDVKTSSLIVAERCRKE